MSGEREGGCGGWRGKSGCVFACVCVWVTKSTAMLNCLIEFTADALKLAVI